MQILKKEEMLTIQGGGISPWVIFGIGTLLSFLAGVIDGFTRPLSCNN